jgi:hypothetical protein
MTTQSPPSPITAIPLYVAGHRFPMAPTCNARFIASAMSPPISETNLEAIERVASTIAALMLSEEDRRTFLGLLGDPADPTTEGKLTQGELLEVWEEVVVHYCARPTDGPPRSSFGSGTAGGGTSWTPASPSPVAPDSSPSSPTSGV